MCLRRKGATGRGRSIGLNDSDLKRPNPAITGRPFATISGRRAKGVARGGEIGQLDKNQSWPEYTDADTRARTTLSLGPYSKRGRAPRPFDLPERIGTEAGRPGATSRDDLGPPASVSQKGADRNRSCPAITGRPDATMSGRWHSYQRDQANEDRRLAEQQTAARGTAVRYHTR